MRITVQYTAQLRSLAQLSEEQVEMTVGGSVEDLLRHLAVLRPELAAHLLSESGDLRTSLMVARDSVAIPIAEANRTKLSDGDTLSLFPPIAGG
jgi:molybdopterin synthase sulfur carrier subunit